MREKAHESFMITVLFFLSLALGVICLCQAHYIVGLKQETAIVRKASNCAVRKVSELSETQPYG